MLAAQVFARELSRVRRLAPTPALVSRANALQVNLNRISTALEALSANPVVGELFPCFLMSNIWID